MEFIQGTVNAGKYQAILTRSLLPSIAKLNADDNFIFQQDGASCHTAKSTQTWLRNNNITVLDWPSSSPDLNIIETVWHKMKKELRENPQRTVADLRAKLQQIWDNFSIEDCQRLADSMPARINAVI